MERAIGIDFCNTIFPMSEAKRKLIEARAKTRIEPPLGKKLDRASVVGTVRIGGVPCTDTDYNKMLSDLWGRVNEFEPHVGSVQTLRHLAAHFNGDVYVLTDVQKETIPLIVDYLTRRLGGSKVRILNGTKLFMARSCDVYIDNDLSVLRRLVDGRRLLMHLTPNGQCSNEAAEGVLSIESWASAIRILQEQGYCKKAA